MKSHIGSGQNPEMEVYLRGMRKQMERERLDTFRGVLMRSRRLEAMVDVSQVPVTKSIRARVQEGDPGSTAGDVGKFWFVFGYSIIGGPDLIRP